MRWKTRARVSSIEGKLVAPNANGRGGSGTAPRAPARLAHSTVDGLGVLSLLDVRQPRRRRVRTPPGLQLDRRSSHHGPWSSKLASRKKGIEVICVTDRSATYVQRVRNTRIVCIIEHRTVPIGMQTKNKRRCRKQDWRRVGRKARCHCTHRRRRIPTTWMQ